MGMSNHEAVFVLVATSLSSLMALSSGLVVGWRLPSQERLFKQEWLAEASSAGPFSPFLIP